MSDTCIIVQSLGRVTSILGLMSYDPPLGRPPAVSDVLDVSFKPGVSGSATRTICR